MTSQNVALLDINIALWAIFFIYSNISIVFMFEKWPIWFSTGITQQRIKIFDAVFDKTIRFGSSITILKLNWNS